MRKKNKESPSSVLDEEDDFGLSRLFNQEDRHAEKNNHSKDGKQK
jgi:hypothetical protein